MARKSPSVIDAKFSTAEDNVMMAVMHHGALTMRGLISNYGPAPNWSRLLDLHYLVTTHTLYGPVASLGAEAREEFHTRGRTRAALETPYLQGPGAIADRAYQQDALSHLRSEGYRLLRHTYKLRGDFKHPSERRYPTGQIVSSTLRVPDSAASRLKFMHRRPVDRLDEIEADDHQSRLGYPSLYATISGGGLTTKRVRELLKLHDSDIVEWRSPLLVVVPDLEPFRDLQRLIDARQAIERAGARAQKSFNHAGVYPLLRLIELPLPPPRRSD